MKPIEETELVSLRTEDLVYERLRRAISRGEFPPGAVLRERVVAEKLGVSRTPVREALVRLETEGFVQRSRRGGVVVPHLSKEGARELFLLRRCLTELIATEAAVCRTTDDIAALERCMEASRRAIEDNDVKRAMDEFRKFDELLGDIARLPRVMSILRTMRDQQAMVGWVTLKKPGRLLQAHEEHQRIAEAVIRGDALAAREAAAEHIRRAEEAFREAFRESDQGVSG